MNLDLSGLDELMAESVFADAPAGRLIELALDVIDFDPEQPRARIDEATLTELAQSIQAHGVLQAISVRLHPEAAGRYLVNFGERRVRAARLVKLKHIPAVIEPKHDPYNQVIENLQREDLSPLDLARFIARCEQAGESRVTIARKLGKSRSFVTEIARLLQAPAPVRALCEDGRCKDVRTLYTLARAGDDEASVIAPLLAGEGPITRAAAEAAVKGEAPGASKALRVGGPARPRAGASRTLLVAVDGRTGALDWKQQPSRSSAVVRFEDGAQETIELERLQIVAWATT